MVDNLMSRPETATISTECEVMCGSPEMTGRYSPPSAAAPGRQAGQQTGLRSRQQPLQSGNRKNNSDHRSGQSVYYSQYFKLTDTTLCIYCFTDRIESDILLTSLRYNNTQY